MRSEQWDRWVVKARSVPIEDEIARRGIKLQGRIERCGPCPKCAGEDRFSINTRKQVFNCRGCGGHGDVIALVQFLDDVDFKAACETLTGEPVPDQKRVAGIKKVVAAEYPYHAVDGVIAFVVERVEYQKADGSFVMKDGKRKKTFRQKRPDPDNPGKWIWNVNGAPIIPYRLPRLLKAIADRQCIIVTEGERCADLLWDLEIAATTNPGGACKWKPELNPFFTGADLILIPDNDDAGHKHVQAVGAALNGIASRIGVLVLPNAPPKGDIADWLAAGGTREQLQELIDQAPNWVPIPAADGKAKAEQSEQELIDKINELAQLSSLQYEQRRRDAARELGIRSSALDGEVEARRNEQRGQIKGPLPHGYWEVEPWPEAVDTDVLLVALKQRVRRHIVLNDHACTVVALWIMLTWVHEIAATHSPILRATSAEANSGKTTLLNLVRYLVLHGLLCVEISEAALFRSVELWTPSLIVDEADVILAENEPLRAVINSGHTRGASVLRCIGDEKTPHAFSTFTPKALGMKGNRLPDTTLSRCIDIALKRKKEAEEVEHFRVIDDAGLQELRSQALRWSIDNAESLNGAEPEMPKSFNNRLGDNFRLMFAIADLARGEWPDKAREAARLLTNTGDALSISVKLLADIKAIFEVKKVEAITSAELVQELTSEADSRWSEWKSGKPITQCQLSVLLKPFTAPDAIWFEVGGKKVQLRGYRCGWFEDAWDRYLPKNPSSG
jgi:putative DNA primase/helicase